MLALHPGQFGTRFGERFLRLLQRGARGIARFAAAFDAPGQRFLRFARLRCGSLRLGQRLLGVLRACLLARALLQPLGLARELRDPSLRRVERGARDTPFGIERGVIRIGARELQLCRTFGLLGPLGIRDHLRQRSLGFRPRCLARRQFGFEPLKRIRRVAPGAPVILAILFQPNGLPVEIGEPGEGCVTLLLKAGEPLLLRARIGARGDQRIARVGEFFRRIALRRLGLARTRLGRLDRGLRLARRLARSLRARRRIAPAGEHQPCLGDADLVGQLGVAFRLLGLPPERGNLTVEPGEQVFQPGEVALGLAQLALGILAPHVEPGDPRRFFQHRASFDRLGRDHVRDLALADEGGGVGAGGRIGKGERDVLGAHIIAVDAVGAARAAFDPADDLQLVAGVVRASSPKWC